MKRYVRPNSRCKPVEQVDHLRLDRDVERRDRLVEDRRSFGLSASARAKPIRCRCPPENSCGKRFPCSGLRPTTPQQLVDPRASSVSPRYAWMRSGSLMMSRTVMRGLSDAYGSWKTIWMSRPIGRSCRRESVVMSRPLKTMLPAVGSVSRMIVRPRVVFPHPDSPTTPSVSPRHDRRGRRRRRRARCRRLRLTSPALIGKYLTRPSTFRIGSRSPRRPLKASAAAGI